MYAAIFSHYLMGREWDDISDSNGFIYLTDNIHLNGRAARITADLIRDFVTQ